VRLSVMKRRARTVTPTPSSRSTTTVRGPSTWMWAPHPLRAATCTAVSCARASSCVAVGDIVGGTSNLLLEGNWDGHGWSAAPRSPSAIVGVAVTCGTGGTCTEVGPSGGVATLETGLG